MLDGIGVFVSSNVDIRFDVAPGVFVGVEIGGNKVAESVAVGLLPRLSISKKSAYLESEQDIEDKTTISITISCKQRIPRFLMIYLYLIHMESQSHTLHIPNSIESNLGVTT